MDVGSSPMVEITSCDVIINKLYTKSQLSIILMSRPFGTTRCCSSLHDHIYKVPAHYCIMTRHLGATYVEYTVLTSDWDEQHGFLQSGNIYIEASLKSSLCSPQDLGATGNMDMRERNLQNSQFWPSISNNYDSASSIYNLASFFIFKPVEGHMSISRPEFKPGQQIDYEVGLFDPDFWRRK